MNKKTVVDLKDEEYENKRVVLRVDYNVPMEKGEISDDSRITKTLPTLNHILGKKIKCLIITSHMGRPKGKVVEKYSLKPVAKRLEEILRKTITFVDDCLSEKLPGLIKDCENGSIFLLENVRFHAEEESKTVTDGVKNFRKILTSYGDIYVGDAFACAHRAHSTIVGIDCEKKVAGLLMKKELDYFDTALLNPKKPYLAILGGAKVDTKIELITNLLTKVNDIIIAGGMAYTFLKVIENMKIGTSLFDEKGSKLVPKIMNDAKKKGVNIYLPSDWVCADKFSNDAKIKIFDKSTGIPDDWMGLDIGPKSSGELSKVITKAKTIIWNGPPGVFEFDNFTKGSKSFVDAVLEATKNGSTSIICGGDSASLAKKYNVVDKFSHVSSGGGASLELCEGKKLPGFEILEKK